MATMAELMRKWVEDGAHIHTRDGRIIPMKQLWEEIYDKNPHDWDAIYGEAPVMATACAPPISDK